MVNKKGFLRIVEAGAAILIILAAILINLNNLKSLKEKDYSETARDILKEIANNETMRTEIITAQNYTQTVINFTDKRLPDFLSFELRSCEISNVCGQSTYQGNVFSGERIIASDISTYNPVKLRLFIWENGK